MRRRLALVKNLLGSSGPPITRPTFAITALSISASDVLSMQIVASEVVTGFAVTDLTISAGGSLGSFATADNITFTVAWTLAAGVNTMDIAQDACTDAEGHGNAAATQFVIGAQETDTIQPDGTAGLDTFINSAGVNTNYGTGTQSYVGDAAAGAGGRERVLFKFSLATIPATAYVVSASLQLYESGAGDTAGVGSWAVNVHRLLKDWVETQATWNIYSTGNNWGTAGAGGDAVDRVASASATLTMDGTAANAFVSFTGLAADVTGFLKSTFANYGWLLEAPAAEETAALAYNRFEMSESATAGQRPKLVVVHRDLP